MFKKDAVGLFGTVSLILSAWRSADCDVLVGLVSCETGLIRRSYLPSKRSESRPLSSNLSIFERTEKLPLSRSHLHKAAVFGHFHFAPQGNLKLSTLHALSWYVSSSSTDTKPVCKSKILKALCFWPEAQNKFVIYPVVQVFFLNMKN